MIAHEQSCRPDQLETNIGGPQNMNTFWWLLGYSEDGLPVVSGDSAKIRSIKRVMKTPVTGAVDEVNRPHPDFQMVFEMPDEYTLKGIILNLRPTVTNSHRQSRRPTVVSPITDDETLSAAIADLRPTPRVDTLSRWKPAKPMPDPLVMVEFAKMCMHEQEASSDESSSWTSDDEF